MDSNRVLGEARTKMAAAVEHFKEELKKLRTGRAHPGMLDNVTVEAYGQQMPLKSLAGITAPDAQLLVVSPFDPNNLEAIVTAIRDNEALGLNPADDGRVIRVAIPPLTTETRQDMVKVLNQRVEEGAVSLRNTRHDAIKQAEQAEKDKSISNDERFKFEKQVDDLLNQHKNQLEELAKTKEQEIMTV
jgi:ribosome recycling factor